MSKQAGRGLGPGVAGGQVRCGPLASCSVSHGVAISAGVRKSLCIRPLTEHTHEMQIWKHSVISLLPGHFSFHQLAFPREGPGGWSSLLLYFSSQVVYSPEAADSA